jgi:hypothetical protein
MEEFVIMFVISAIAFMAGSISNSAHTVSLQEAQRDYKECIRLGAPQQRCLEEFLLKEDGNERD